MPESSKTRFLKKSAYVKSHFDLVVSEPFIAACDAAMLSLVDDLGGNPTSETELSAANHQRLVGARLFLQKLLTIADAPKPISPKSTGDNLKHDV